MNAQLKPQAPQHDYEGEAAELAARAFNAEVDAIKADPSRLAEIDVIAAEGLDEDTYTDLYTVLADLSDCGAVNTLTRSAQAWAMNDRQLFAFAQLARLADRMADVREVEVRKAVGL